MKRIPVKKTWILIAAVLLSCVFCAGCVLEEEIIINCEDEYQYPLAYAVGTEVTITAKANPTTGYSWTIIESDGLTIISDEYIPDEAEEGEVGVGGTQKWVVTAEKTGAYIFKAEYKRPWEEEAIKRVTHELTFS